VYPFSTLHRTPFAQAPNSTAYSRRKNASNGTQRKLRRIRGRVLVGIFSSLTMSFQLSGLRSLRLTHCLSSPFFSPLPSPFRPSIRNRNEHFLTVIHLSEFHRFAAYIVCFFRVIRDSKSPRHPHRMSSAFPALFTR